MNKKQIVVLSFSIIMLALVLLGGSYAYLRRTTIQLNNNVISTLSCLDISLSDVSAPITLTGVIPKSDANGMVLTGYNFRIRNNCNNKLSVKINLESLAVSNQLSLSYIKYSLNGSTPALLSSRTTISPATISGATSKNIFNTTVFSNEEKEYNLKLWILESSTFANAGNKNFEGKIVVTATYLKDTCLEKPAVFANAASGTILNKLNNDHYCYNAPETTPGRVKSTETEAVLASTVDDYGTSYYFRGNVENNYVVFANMCWRIVRITGNDGNGGNYNHATKLILYNYNPSNMVNPCTQIMRTYAYARHTGTTYSTGFNGNNNYNAYVGYMYGTPNSSTYEASHENRTDSTMLTKLKSWFDAKLSTYEGYLADTVWCNDKRLGSTGTGAGTNSTSYAAKDRLSPVSSAAPSLKCGDTPSDNQISKFTAQDTTYGNGMLKKVTDGQPTKYYPIGLMTADELAFAGYIYNTTSGYSYLTPNTNTVWLLMTPYNGGSSSNIFDVNAERLYSAYTKTSYDVRPMISLKGDIQVTGTGTSIDPFVVQPINAS